VSTAFPPLSSEEASTPYAPGESAFRRRVPTATLLVATALVLYVCYRIVTPFVTVFAWSFTLSAATYPAYARLERRCSNRNVAAAIAVFVLALGIIVPVGFVAREIVIEGAAHIHTVSAYFDEGYAVELGERYPRARRVFEWAERNLNVQQGIRGLQERAGAVAANVVKLSIFTLVQFFLVLFTCFFLYRDKQSLVGSLREYLPLSRRETDEMFVRVRDTVYATFYGTFAVALVQGSLGGLMFWLLGLPASLVWGAVMAFLALIPYLGASIIWIPAALFLAIQGQSGKAIILATWGAGIVALVDNLLYPVLVGKRLHFHTALVFFFFIGGISLFGASGVVLGPLTLAVTHALLEVWKGRVLSARAYGS
jgi:predicted PurR-regulated permease PerM